MTYALKQSDQTYPLIGAITCCGEDKHRVLQVTVHLLDCSNLNCRAHQQAEHAKIVPAFPQNESPCLPVPPSAQLSVHCKESKIFWHASIFFLVFVKSQHEPVCLPKSSLLHWSPCSKVFLYTGGCRIQSMLGALQAQRKQSCSSEM